MEGQVSMTGDPQLDTVAGFLKPSMELLTYYRQKIVGFEKERAEYIERLAVVERHNGELHRLRWELRSREEEVRESTLRAHHFYDSNNQFLPLYFLCRSQNFKSVLQTQKCSYLMSESRYGTMVRVGKFPRKSSISQYHVKRVSLHNAGIKTSSGK